MKLLGTRLEDTFRSQLQRSHEALFLKRENPRLLKSVCSAFPQTRSAYVLHWIPEQGEDIYTVLVNDNAVATFELSRFDEDIVSPNKVLSIEEYKKNLKINKQIQLAVALDLAASL